MNDIIKTNKDGWNKLVKTNSKYSNTVLPDYGPFLKRNEEEIRLMSDINGKKVLDFGCGSGGSLEYLYKRGASEIWGIDISEEQIKKAKEKFLQFKNNFFVAPMEEEVDIPNNYFDYIISIYSIGYTSNIYNALKNAYKYLKDNGSLIISWTHPFYNCINLDNNLVVVSKSYFDENYNTLTKGSEKVDLIKNNLKISSIINIARSIGLYVDVMIEEETIEEEQNDYKSRYFKKELSKMCPTTLILKLKKLNI